MSKVNHLKIVPYNPTDYSLGEYLVKEHGTISEDEQFIGGALSLYFQWPDHSFCHLSNTPKDEEPTKCTLDYDRDERFPTELWVKHSGAREFKEFEKVYIRFEVFRTCYEFDISVLSVNTETDETFLVCSVPTKIQVYKNRRFPRVYLKEDQKLEIAWVRSNDSTSQKLQVKEIGMKSLATAHADGIEPGIGTIKIANLEVPAELFKLTKTKAIFVLKFERSIDAGHFFDVYRLYAYPSLRSRHEIPYEKGLKLYKDSGYFDKFSTEDIKKAYEEIPKVWEGIMSGTHDTTADYYTVDENGEPTGCSSVTHAFFNHEIPTWAFHQLCALKIPELINYSGQLYTWRAEYLLSRNEDLTSIVWFDSKSRWLERIYVNFSLRDGNVKLHKIKARKFKFTSNDSGEHLKYKTITIGELKRTSVSFDSEIYFGLLPHFINAATNLDSFFLRKKKLPSTELNLLLKRRSLISKPEN